MSDVSEQDLREYREAENTKDVALSPRATRPGGQRAKVLSVRLNPGEFDELARYASAVDVPASALVRGWILDQLRASAESSTVKALPAWATQAAARQAEADPPRDRRRTARRDSTRRTRSDTVTTPARADGPVGQRVRGRPSPPRAQYGMGTINPRRQASDAPT